MKHGNYWTIKEGQNTDRLFLSYGMPEPRGGYTEPLVTIERAEPGGDTWEAVRYFERLTEEEWEKWRDVLND